MVDGQTQGQSISPSYPVAESEKTFRWKVSVVMNYTVIQLQVSLCTPDLKSLGVQ